MNNAVKHEIYPKVAIHLSGLIDVIVQNDSLTVTKSPIAAIIRHEKQTDMPITLKRKEF